MAAVETRPLGALGRMGVVAAFHVAVILVLANSFGLLPKAEVPPDVQLVPVDDAPPIDEPLPPIDDSNLRLETTVFVPAPENPAVDNSTEGAITAELRPADEIPIDRGSAVPVPEIIGPRVDSRRPLSQPRYPSELIRSGTEGAVDVEVYVQPNGRIGDARIARSSGHEAFDRATLEEARRNWRLLPATQDGQPIAHWYRMRVVFKLTNR